MERGTIHIYSGDGHGKSPAALGRAVAMACQGKNVVIIQFLKGKGLEDSEFLRRLEPEIKFFRFAKTEKNFAELSKEEQEEEAINIRNGFNFARKVLVTGECSLLILDEFLGLWENRLISEEDLDSLMNAASEDTEIIFTGRVMGDSLRKYIGKVYEIHENC